MEKRNVESARRSRVLGLFALLVAAIGVIVAGTVALAAPGDTNVDPDAAAGVAAAGADAAETWPE